MSTNITGVIVTSSSCSGTCLTFSIPRQPKVSAADSGARARRARGRGDRLADRRLVGAGGRGRLAVVGLALMPPAPPRSAIACLGGLLLGRVAGQGQEHLVEARLAEREVGDPDPGADSSATASAPRSASAQGTESAAGSGSSLTLAELARRARARPRAAARDRAAVRAGRRARPMPSAAPGVPSAITLPWSITAIPSQSWSASSRYWVQSRIVVPPATKRADDVPDLVARARIEPGGRLVEEHQLGRDDDARGDVEPPAHAAGVVLDQPPGGVGEAERLQQLGRPAPSPRSRFRPSRRAIRIRFSRPVRSSSTEASWPVRLTAPRTASASRDDVVPEHAGAARVGAKQRREHPDRRSSCRRRWGRARRRPSRAAPPGRRRRRPCVAEVS